MTTAERNASLWHRPASGACPSGAWQTAHYHTHKREGRWMVWLSGDRIVDSFSTAKEAKAYMVRKELEQPL